MTPICRITPLLLLALPACSDVEKAGSDGHDGHHHHDHEVITTVVLTFTSQTDDSETSFTWTDADNSASPTIDDVILQDADDYNLSVAFLNELEDPAEDITREVSDEADEHQLFFTGSAVEGPATGTNADAIIAHNYADTDADDLPLGLYNSISKIDSGSGELTVTLRHLPPENGNPVKTEGMAEDIAAGGFGSVGGENDVQVSFNIEVE
jgi:hypothetical protein